MTRFISGLVLAVGLLSLGCGGTVDETPEATPLEAAEQELWSCNRPLDPPCPEGWCCDQPAGTHGSCRLCPTPDDP